MGVAPQNGHGQGLIQDFWLGGDNNMLEYQTCIRYVIVLAILHIFIVIGLTNKLQNRHIELYIASWLITFLGFQCINFSSEGG